MDAEDVLHEAFLRALDALDLFEPRSDHAFFAWVFTIAKNLLLDQGKRRSAGVPHFAAGSQAQGPRASQVPASDRRPDSLLAKKGQVESLLKRLKPEEAEVIRQHWIDGLAFEEMAAATGLFDHIVVNDDLGTAIGDLVGILSAPQGDESA